MAPTEARDLAGGGQMIDSELVSSFLDLYLDVPFDLSRSCSSPRRTWPSMPHDPRPARLRHARATRAERARDREAALLPQPQARRAAARREPDRRGIVRVT
jgi:hypothetical protein